ncbi:DUF5667 domain-containing protein [Halanaerobaculum tunisiense]
MKKIIFCLLLILILNVSTVLAADNSLTTENKISADSPFYFLDKTGEKVKLLFSKGQDKAKLKFIYAYERLLETGEMLEKEKTDKAGQLFKEAVNNFTTGVKISAQDSIDSKELQQLKEDVNEAMQEVKKEMLHQKVKLDKFTNQLKDLF